jgi:hypothetical protein
MRRKRWRAQSKAFRKTEPEKDQLKRNHEAWKLVLKTQSALAMVVIGSAVALAWHSKMDATITGS